MTGTEFRYEFSIRSSVANSQAVLDLVPSADHCVRHRVGAQLKLARLARIVHERSSEVGHASVRVIGVARPRVEERVVKPHLLAHRPVKVASLVFAERHIALEPRVGDSLRVERVGASSSVDGELLEQSSKVLHSCGIKLAMFGVRGSPVGSGHELGESTSRSARVLVPDSSIEAVVFHEGGKVGLVFHASVGHRDEKPDGTHFGNLARKARRARCRRGGGVGVASDVGSFGRSLRRLSVVATRRRVGDGLDRLGNLLGDDGDAGKRSEYLGACAA